MIREIKVDSNPLMLQGHYAIWRDGAVVGCGIGWPADAVRYDRITVSDEDFEAVKKTLDGKSLP